jgi:hypothetical protein
MTEPRKMVDNEERFNVDMGEHEQFHLTILVFEFLFLRRATKWIEWTY